MKATELLKHEHRAILLVIAAVEEEVASITKTGKIHARTVRQMADFLQNFVDRCHHGKEEKHLFAILHERGMPLKTGPLAGLLREHARGRTGVRAVAEAVAGRAAPGAAAIRKAKKHLTAYATLIRAHMEKEDDVLYVVADRILDAQDQQSLCDAFEKLESEEIGEGVHEKYHAWIEELAGT